MLFSFLTWSINSCLDYRIYKTLEITRYYWGIIWKNGFSFFKCLLSDCYNLDISILIEKLPIITSHKKLNNLSLRKKCPYLELFSSAFQLNTERYAVSFRNQSECRKMPTRITPNTDTFHAVSILIKNKQVHGCTLKTKEMDERKVSYNFRILQTLSLVAFLL